MSKLPFKVWSLDRMEKRTFIAESTIESVIEKEETEEWISANTNDTFATIVENLSASTSQALFEALDNDTEVQSPHIITVPPASPSTTLSWSSTALSSSSSINLECGKFAETFNIPCEKFPPDVNNLLQERKYLGKKLNTIGNIIVDEMKKFSFYLPLSVIRSISQKCASKYP